MGKPNDFALPRLELSGRWTVRWCAAIACSLIVGDVCGVSLNVIGITAGVPCACISIPFLLLLAALDRFGVGCWAKGVAVVLPSLGFITLLALCVAARETAEGRGIVVGTAWVCATCLISYISGFLAAEGLSLFLGISTQQKPDPNSMKCESGCICGITIGQWVKLWGIATGRSMIVSFALIVLCWLLPLEGKTFVFEILLGVWFLAMLVAIPNLCLFAEFQLLGVSGTIRWGVLAVALALFSIGVLYHTIESPQDTNLSMIIILLLCFWLTVLVGVVLGEREMKMLGEFRGREFGCGGPAIPQNENEGHGSEIEGHHP